MIACDILTKYVLYHLHPVIAAVTITTPYKSDVEMDNKNQKHTNSDESHADNDKWGYMVCFGTIICFIAGIGHINSSGLIYNDFIISTHSTAKSLTAAHGVFAIMLAIGGIILNVISKRFSLRFGGLLGAIVLSIGSFSTIFISNINQLPVTFGAMQGVGFGMIVPVCYSTLNYYFIAKRTTVMSMCKAMQGIILMWYPQLLKLIFSSYGFRGTLLIISGITLHTFPGILVMKTYEKPRKINTNIECGNKGDENIDLLNHNIKSNELLDEKPQNSQNGVVKKVRLIIQNNLNLKILKDPIYCNICIGQSFVNFSDITFFVLQPMLLFQYGYDKSQVAFCISICAGADVAGRFALAAISSVVPVNTRILYFVTTLFTLIIRIAILQVREFIWVAIVTGALGVLRAWLHIASPVVISNYVSHEDFPGAYALFLLSAGIVNVVFAPTIGMLKDEYQDYIPAFYALALCCLPCLVFWTIEYFVRRKS